MTYFDMSDFSFGRQSTYTFPDNSFITSITCGKGFAVYSRMFDDYSLRSLKLNTETNEWSEHWHSEERDGLYESVYLTYYDDNKMIHILNSRILQKGKYRHIQLEISEMREKFENDTCIFMNQTMFNKKIGFPIKYNFKLDMYNKTYTMKSSHSGKSFMMSLGRRAMHSIDWNEEASSFQFFDSYKSKSEIIDILANNQNNSIALVHIREDDSLYLIQHQKYLTVHRELDTKKNLVKEVSYSMSTRLVIPQTALLYFLRVS